MKCLIKKAKILVFWLVTVSSYLVSTAASRVPWVPEDIFFLLILMVGGEAALTRKKITGSKENYKEPKGS